MRAAFISGYGSQQKLTVGDRPVPDAGDNDVLIEIRAASVNPIDFKIRDGKLRFLRKYSFPLVLGHDLSGVVTKIGRNVSRFKVGDSVYSRARNGRIGTFAEYIAVDQDDIALMPKNLSFEEAASIPLVGLTSWQALVDTAKIKSGDRVFIQAGAGGIGSFAIQLAKQFGAKVVTTASKQNEEFVRSLGADEVIDYRSQDFASVLRDLDIVYDTIGGEALYRSFPLVKPGGYIVSISGDPDANIARQMNLGFFKTMILRLAGRKAQRLAKKHGVNYRFLFMRPDAQELEKIGQLLASGKIKANVGRVYDLNNVQEAIEHSESGRSKGKIVIRVK